MNFTSFMLKTSTFLVSSYLVISVASASYLIEEKNEVRNTVQYITEKHSSSLDKTKANLDEKEKVTSSSFQSELYTDQLQSNWMTILYNDDPTFKNQKLSNIVIPGTHDGGCYIFPPVYSCYAQTQSNSITNQLIKGVRYFDLRFEAFGSDYNIHHGGYMAGDIIPGTEPPERTFVTLKDNILPPLVNFLKNPSKELVILQITHFENFTPQNYDDFFNLIQQKLGTFLVQPWSDGTIPTLQQVVKNSTGAVIITTTADNPPSYCWSVLPAPYDESVYQSRDLNKIKSFIESNFDQYENKLWVAQGVMTGKDPFSPCISTSAEVINPQFCKWLLSDTWANKINIFISDYIADDLVKAAISLNYGQISQGWINTRKIQGQYSGWVPALATFNNALYMVYCDSNSNQLWQSSTTDGSSWGNTRKIQGQTTGSPASLAVLNNALYMVYKDDVSDQLYQSSTTDGSSWDNTRKIQGQYSGWVPALATFNNALYMVYCDSNSNQLWQSSTTDGSSWGNTRKIQGQTTGSPASLAVLNNALYMVYKDDVSDQLYQSSTTDGSSWGNTRKIQGQYSGWNPSLAAFNNGLSDALYMVYCDSNSPQLWQSLTKRGETWSAQQIQGQTTGSPASLAVFNNALYMAYKDADPKSSQLYQSMSPGVRDQRL